ncbi:MAG: hypothetical protein HW416_269 [Chloroflexi bacterium]|nr:hypothetical protein [Chloroflexota bacterium]
MIVHQNRPIRPGLRHLIAPLFCATLIFGWSSPDLALRLAAQTDSPGPSDAMDVLLAMRGRGLWSIDPDQGTMNEIVARPVSGYISNARWSPDSSRVAYAESDATWRVRVAAADGSGARTIVEGERGVVYDAPVWAPDGQSLFVLHAGLMGAVYIARIERIGLTGGEPEIVGFGFAHFDVSPDGQWLASVRLGRAIDLVNLQTGETRILVPEDRFAVITAPRFDPASRRLAFSATIPGALPTPVPPGLFPPIGWLFSAGVASAHGLLQDVWVVDLDGGAPTQLTQTESDDPVVAWSPDGSQLAILSHERLMTTSVDGTRARTLLAPGDFGSVDWTNRQVR